MEIHTNSEPSLTVTFNKAELEYLVDITQSYCEWSRSYENESDTIIREKLFALASRALGYSINCNGTLNKGVK